ncbi:MAG: hypothetical protein ABI140_00120 [Jatrophihabitantaceae bacterium]
MELDPIARRSAARGQRLLAVLLAPLALALLVAGVLVAVLSGSLAGHLFGGVLALFALLLLVIVQGLLRTARLSERAARERQVDAAILAAAGPCGSDCGSGGCGVDDCAVKALPRA